MNEITDLEEHRAKRKKQSRRSQTVRPSVDQTTEPDRGVRTIRIEAGQLPREVDEAEAALLEGCPDLFQRAGFVVRPALSEVDVADGRQIEAVRLVRVSKHHLVERLTQVARWEKFDARHGGFSSADAPMKVAETFLAREGLWRLPPLAGVINAPTLRPDGSVLDAPGYDHATGLLFEPGLLIFEPIPKRPSKDDAAAAIKRVEQLLESFPFEAETDRAVALSGILTACVRRSLPSAPMHAFSAPVAGSGKSALVDVASVISCGRQAAVLTQGHDETETEKRLGAALLAGDAVISLDNAERAIDGELLCQILTQPTVRLRILGASELRDLPTNCAVFATGNGLVIQGDMTRRSLVCSLDPHCERPELRRFEFNPVERAMSGRAGYLRDALIVLRAFHLAARPRQVSALGSFEIWSDWVRGALLWLGRSDPAETMEKSRANDPKLETLRAVMYQWREVIGSDRILVSDLIKRAVETEMPAYAGQGRHVFVHEQLREALLAAAGRGGSINSKSLGRWLSNCQGRLVDGMKFQKSGEQGGSAVWSLLYSDVQF